MPRITMADVDTTMAGKQTKRERNALSIRRQGIRKKTNPSFAKKGIKRNEQTEDHIHILIIPPESEPNAVVFCFSTHPNMAELYEKNKHREYYLSGTQELLKMLKDKKNTLIPNDISELKTNRRVHIPNEPGTAGGGGGGGDGDDDCSDSE